MSIYGVHKFCRAALHDGAMRELIRSDPEAAMRQFPLTDEERALLRAGDVATLWERGASGFLMSYLTRWDLLSLTVEVYSERIRKAKDWRRSAGAAVTSGRERHEEYWR